VSNKNNAVQPLHVNAGGYDDTFLSRENLSLVQWAFGPLFRDTDKEHPRMAQAAKELITVTC